ncbi:MAG TPA: hypothetical protein VIJ95_13075 [Hanamia sp.]
MKRNKIAFIVIILFGLININTECSRNQPTPPDYKYQFQEKVSVTPYQLNYHVGDTIFFLLDVPGKKFYDSKTNSNVFFDSASFNMGVYINLVYNNPYVGDGPFASFIFPLGVSAYTTSYSGTTQAYLTTGCSQSTDYVVKVGAVLTQKGAFAIGAFCNSLQNCFNGYATNAQLMLSLDVPDTHKSFYNQLPFQDIGKFQSPDVLSQLDSKIVAVINVE